MVVQLLGWHMRYIFLISFLVVSSCSQHFHTFAQSAVSPRGSGLSEVEVTFLGTSSFLVSTAHVQVLIDGYVSRERHNLFGRIEPNVARVAGVLNDIGVTTPNVAFSNGAWATLDSSRRLDAIIPLHGHYDHAMDVGVVAGLTGAPVFGDEFVHRIVEMSVARFDWLSGRMRQDQFVPIAMSHDGASTLVFGDMTITLFEMPHSENFLSRSLDAFGDAEGWAFPARISNMKQGVSLAAHIAVGDRAFLIVPTAGALDGQVARHGVVAETVFLGIGGLGWQNNEVIEDFVSETITASRARRVFPIHWDDHQVPLREGLNIPFYERLDPVLDALTGLEDVDVRPIQIMQRFDPFQ